MFKIYIDTCCLQRPLDDQTQAKIRIESEAVFAILSLVQTGYLELLSSSALEYEINRIPDEQRREDALAILTVATERLTLSHEVDVLAENLEQQGIDAMDAVHLAYASSAQADFFVTCDSAFLRKAKRCANLSCRCISILDVLSEVES